MGISALVIAVSVLILVAILTKNNKSVSQKVVCINGGSDIPVLTLYYVTWCKFCKSMKPVWEDIKIRYNGLLRFNEIDCDQQKVPDVTSYPTIVLRTRGRVHTYTDGADMKKISNWITFHTQENWQGTG